MEAEIKRNRCTFRAWDYSTGKEKNAFALSGDGEVKVTHYDGHTALEVDNEGSSNNVFITDKLLFDGVELQKDLDDLQDTLFAIRGKADQPELSRADVSDIYDLADDVIHELEQLNKMLDGGE